MSNIYGPNTFPAFWGLPADLSPEMINAAIAEAAPLLPDGAAVVAEGGWDALMTHILGEGQFGPNHWRLSSARRLYYSLRPLLPVCARPLLRALLRRKQGNSFPLGWPIEDRYVRFLYAALDAVQRQCPGIQPLPFWPSGARFAFVITHDVESAAGQAFVRALAAVDERYGFRSSFNFVPEGYPVDRSLIGELHARGFEVGVHGLKHDGRLFSSRAEFERQAARINACLREWGAVGFRSPFTHRHPEWLQSLEIEYDASFFDTDPYETIAGGTMSIWPFFCGRFVELPYTLAQDHILFEMGRDAQFWLDKVDFIARWGGMVLVNAHPDYLREPAHLEIYEEFLQAMAGRRRNVEPDNAPAFWHALPRDLARWWRQRANLMLSGGPSS
ncbi:MAG: hypothetical protein ONB30_00255 [candidate division KSB1 bacterium]|nr:hypothetical protein [candidate division KSB1 bacterium]